MDFFSLYTACTVNVCVCSWALLTCDTIKPLTGRLISVKNANSDIVKVPETITICQTLSFPSSIRVHNRSGRRLTPSPLLRSLKSEPHCLEVNLPLRSAWRVLCHGGKRLAVKPGMKSPEAFRSSCPCTRFRNTSNYLTYSTVAGSQLSMSQRLYVAHPHTPFFFLLGGWEEKRRLSQLSERGWFSGFTFIHKTWL